MSAWHNLPTVSWLGFACLLVLSVFFLINWIGALTPDVRFDAVKSHLALARMYATDHQVTGLLYSIGSYLAHERRNAVHTRLSHSGRNAAKLFHFGAGVLAAGFVYLAGHRLDSPLTGLVVGYGLLHHTHYCLGSQYG